MHRPRAGGPIRHKLSLIVAETRCYLIPAFRDAWVGGPKGHKFLDRGSWVKFHGSWNGGLD